MKKQLVIYQGTNLTHNSPQIYQKLLEQKNVNCSVTHNNLTNTSKCPIISEWLSRLYHFGELICIH